MSFQSITSDTKTVMDHQTVPAEGKLHSFRSIFFILFLLSTPTDPSIRKKSTRKSFLEKCLNLSQQKSIFDEMARAEGHNPTFQDEIDADIDCLLQILVEILNSENFEKAILSFTRATDELNTFRHLITITS